jgi:hypothetical protein
MFFSVCAVRHTADVALNRYEVFDINGIGAARGK